MDSKTDKQSFKVGDEVCREAGYFSSNDYHIGTVIKVTPSGRATVKFAWGERIFNPDGRQRASDSYNPGRISLVTPEIKEKILKKQAIEEIKIFLNSNRSNELEKVSLSELELITKVIKTWREQK